MGVLEQVIKLKSQGISDLQIINSLSQQGIPPSDIDSALKQAQIKNAVSDFKEDEELQPSIMQDEQISTPEKPKEYNPPEYSPQQVPYPPQADVPYQQVPQQTEYYPQQYSQQPQEYQSYSPQQSSTNTDTIIEIADQIFSEKIRKVQKQLENTTENTILLQTKVENISDRLKKIENMIDKLQIAILERVGSYGQNLESIKKEMGMMQDSFSKMISPETKRQVENITEKLKKI
jgi:hypothetical protein